MKFYSYDYNGVLIGEGDAELCQVTEQKRLSDPSIEPVYIVPSYSTLSSPPVTPEGCEAVFNGSDWEVKQIPKPVEPVKEPEYIPTYADKRALEYPDFRIYLDGIVKGDEAQINKYIQDCLAVKAKYPKPDGV